MVETQSETGSSYSRSEWTKLSIQDRIKAMNQFDIVSDESPPKLSSNSQTVSAGRATQQQEYEHESTEEAPAPSTSRRSVVDIWRTRGKGGDDDEEELAQPPTRNSISSINDAITRGAGGGMPKWAQQKSASSGIGGGATGSINTGGTITSSSSFSSTNSNRSSPFLNNSSGTATKHTPQPIQSSSHSLQQQLQLQIQQRQSSHISVGHGKTTENEDGQSSTGTGSVVDTWRKKLQNQNNDSNNVEVASVTSANQSSSVVDWPTGEEEEEGEEGENVSSNQQEQSQIEPQHQPQHQYHRQQQPQATINNHGGSSSANRKSVADIWTNRATTKPLSSSSDINPRSAPPPSISPAALVAASSALSKPPRTSPRSITGGGNNAAGSGGSPAVPLWKQELQKKNRARAAYGDHPDPEPKIYESTDDEFDNGSVTTNSDNGSLLSGSNHSVERMAERWNTSSNSNRVSSSSPPASPGGRAQSKSPASLFSAASNTPSSPKAKPPSPRGASHEIPPWKKRVAAMQKEAATSKPIMLRQTSQKQQSPRGNVSSQTPPWVKQQVKQQDEVPQSSGSNPPWVKHQQLRVNVPNNKDREEDGNEEEVERLVSPSSMARQQRAKEEENSYSSFKGQKQPSWVKSNIRKQQSQQEQVVSPKQQQQRPWVKKTTPPATNETVQKQDQGDWRRQQQQAPWVKNNARDEEQFSDETQQEEDRIQSREQQERNISPWMKQRMKFNSVGEGDNSNDRPSWAKNRNDYRNAEDNECHQQDNAFVPSGKDSPRKSSRNKISVVQQNVKLGTNDNHHDLAHNTSILSDETDEHGFPTTSEDPDEWWKSNEHSFSFEGNDAAAAAVDLTIKGGGDGFGTVTKKKEWSPHRNKYDTSFRQNPSNNIDKAEGKNKIDRPQTNKESFNTHRTSPSSLLWKNKFPSEEPEGTPKQASASSSNRNRIVPPPATDSPGRASRKDIVAKMKKTRRSYDNNTPRSQASTPPVTRASPQRGKRSDSKVHTSQTNRRSNVQVSDHVEESNELTELNKDVNMEEDDAPRLGASPLSWVSPTRSTDENTLPTPESQRKVKEIRERIKKKDKDDSSSVYSDPTVSYVSVSDTYTPHLYAGYSRNKPSKDENSCSTSSKSRKSNKYKKQLTLHSPQSDTGLSAKSNRSSKSPNGKAKSEVSANSFLSSRAGTLLQQRRKPQRGCKEVKDEELARDLARKVLTGSSRKAKPRRKVDGQSAKSPSQSIIENEPTKSGDVDVGAERGLSPIQQNSYLPSNSASTRMASSEVGASALASRYSTSARFLDVVNNMVDDAKKSMNKLTPTGTNYQTGGGDPSRTYSFESETTGATGQSSYVPNKDEVSDVSSYISSVQQNGDSQSEQTNMSKRLSSSSSSKLRHLGGFVTKEFSENTVTNFDMLQNAYSEFNAKQLATDTITEMTEGVSGSINAASQSIQSMLISDNNGSKKSNTDDHTTSTKSMASSVSSRRNKNLRTSPRNRKQLFLKKKPQRPEDEEDVAIEVEYVEED